MPPTPIGHPNARRNTHRMTRLDRTALTPLPLGEIRPAGWLLDQLTIQADGLTGHLDEFWPDVAHSGWIGGDAEGWERGPYWLDGVVPLAFLLDDDRLQAKVRHWIDYILDHQHDDGWFGPPPTNGAAQPRDQSGPAPQQLQLRSLAALHPPQGADTVPGGNRRPAHGPGDGALPPPAPRDRHSHIATPLVGTLPLGRPCRHHPLAPRPHRRALAARPRARKLRRAGLRLADPLRALAVRDGSCAKSAASQPMSSTTRWGSRPPESGYRQSGDTGDRAAVRTRSRCSIAYHGQATGVFSGDEHLAGRSPSQGTELCAVVEYHVLARSAARSPRQRRPRRPSRTDRLQRAARNDSRPTCGRISTSSRSTR